VGLGHFNHRHQFFQQRSEFEFGEKRTQGFQIGRADLHGIDVQLHRDVAIDGYQLLAEQDVVAVVLQRLAISLFFDFRCAIERRFDRAKTLNQIDRTLVTDSRGAGNVIDTVAAQGHDVNDPTGRHPEDFLHFCRVANQIVFRRIEYQHPIVDQLQHVFVARDDVHAAGLRGGLRGQSADDVVGFVSGEFEDGNAISLQRTADIRHLLHEVGRHLLAVGFVSVIFGFLKCLRLQIEPADAGNGLGLLLAKSWRGHVKNGGQILGREIISQFAQHVDKYIRRSCRQASLGGHAALPRHGMIGAENERHGVDQEDVVGTGVLLQTSRDLRSSVLRSGRRALSCSNRAWSPRRQQLSLSVEPARRIKLRRPFLRPHKRFGKIDTPARTRTIAKEFRKTSCPRGDRDYSKVMVKSAFTSLLRAPPGELRKIR
jgi:hypothetical protein